jgi:hypothetical protein
LIELTYRYSADIGPRILTDYAKKYFLIDFPLPKMDMAAIPDFSAGSFHQVLKLIFFIIIGSIYCLFLACRCHGELGSGHLQV